MKSKDTIEEEDVNDMIQGMTGNISWFQLFLKIVFLYTNSGKIARFIKRANVV